MADGILAEVRDFLSGLRRESPELFFAPRPVRPARPARYPVFEERAAHWAAFMGVDYGIVRVKDQRTLWGSCTRDGNLNFNWRLTLAPPEVLDYVVIHELAHRVEMNHSPRFWTLVERFCPEQKERRRWLKRNGRALQSAARSETRSTASAGESPESHSPLG